MTRLACLIALLWSVPAAAADQDRPSAGDLSLSFGLPGGGNDTLDAAAGVWGMVSDRVNLGINVGFGLDPEDDQPLDLALVPAVRVYLNEDGRVAPFVLGEARLAISDNEAAGFDGRLRVAGGLGGEVWLIDELSIAGHVGLAVDLIRGTGRSPALGTFTSGLTLNLYLR
ncbi:MAG: hypothetical protein AAGA48_11350 [Myxococcota bacterium]